VNQPLTPEQKTGIFTQAFAYTRAYFDDLEQQGNREVTVQDRTLHSLCRPDRLLELTYQFTLFDAGVKKIARYQQYFTVKETLERIREYDEKRCQKRTE